MATAALLTCQHSAAQTAPVPPSDDVAILGQGSVSLPDRYEFCSTMSRDRRTIYIGIEHGSWQSLEAYRWQDGGWSEAEQVYGSPEYAAQDPYLSQDERRLYFITRAEGNADIGYLQQGEDGAWGDPVLLDAPVNTSANDYFVSITKQGDVFWSSDRGPGGGYDIYRANPSEDVEAERLPEPISHLGRMTRGLLEPGAGAKLAVEQFGTGRYLGDQEWMVASTTFSAWSPRRSRTMRSLPEQRSSSSCGAAVRSSSRRRLLSQRRTRSAGRPARSMLPAALKGPRRL